MLCMCMKSGQVTDQFLRNFGGSDQVGSGFYLTRNKSGLGPKNSLASNCDCSLTHWLCVCHRKRKAGDSKGMKKKRKKDGDDDDDVK